VDVPEADVGALDRTVDGGYGVEEALGDLVEHGRCRRISSIGIPAAWSASQDVGFDDARERDAGPASAFGADGVHERLIGPAESHTSRVLSGTRRWHRRHR
jgi:hypothetical protein